MKQLTFLKTFHCLQRQKHLPFSSHMSCEASRCCAAAKSFLKDGLRQDFCTLPAPKSAFPMMVTAAPLVHLISETMRVQNTAPKNLKVSAIQKRFMDKTFLPSVDRQLIRDGAKQLHWEIGNLTSKAISAIRENESAIRQALKN